MRTLLLIAVLATFASVTTSAEAQWLRSRRSSGCANGQCGSGLRSPRSRPGNTRVPTRGRRSSEQPGSPGPGGSTPSAGSGGGSRCSRAGNAPVRADANGQRQFVQNAVGQRGQHGTPLGTHPQPAVKSASQRRRS